MTNNSPQIITTPFSLKQAAQTLKNKATPDGLYVEDILITFGSRSEAFLVLFFTLPFLQPVPMMGLSSVFGSLIMLLGIFIAFNKPIWLPQKILRKHISSKLVVSCCDVLIGILNRTERFIKPRLVKWTQLRFSAFINGTLIFIFAFLLALPLPIPFSNAVPAWFLLFNALGKLEEDGYVLILSYIVALGGFIFFWGISAAIWQVFDWAKAYIL